MSKYKGTISLHVTEDETSIPDVENYRGQQIIVETGLDDDPDADPNTLMGGLPNDPDDKWWWRLDHLINLIQIDDEGE